VNARKHPAALREAFEAVDPEPVIALLEEMVSERRKERILRVLAERLACVCVLMDAPHDPHNGAAVIRSCEAFGVQRLHVVERDHRFEVSNAVAKGAERWVDVIAHGDAETAVAELARERFVLVGTHPQGSLLPEALSGIGRLALVMGNEHDGISEAIDAACHAHVRVPMRGFVESLNVSVTAAIVLSQATAGRAGDLSEGERRRLYARALVLTVPRALEILAARGIDLPIRESLAVALAKQ
jgi:tRNA (guanosine-2'-O-)-methyltransferase